MGYEERMEARSDFIAENCDKCAWEEECDDCSKYDEGLEQGIRSRKFYNLEQIKKPFQKISAILTAYGNFDPNIRLLKVEFFKLAVFMFNEDTSEFTKKCPCRPECEF